MPLRLVPLLFEPHSGPAGGRIRGEMVLLGTLFHGQGGVEDSEVINLCGTTSAVHVSIILGRRKVRFGILKFLFALEVVFDVELGFKRVLFDIAASRGKSRRGERMSGLWVLWSVDK